MMVQSTNNETLHFFIDDWLLPYEISHRYYLGGSGHGVIDLETLVPKNMGEVFKRLLKPNAFVAIKTIDNFEVVKFKAISIKITQIVSSLDEPVSVNIQYKE